MKLLPKFLDFQVEGLSKKHRTFFFLYLFFILAVCLFFFFCFPFFLLTVTAEMYFIPIPSHTDVQKLFPKVYPPNCISEKMPSLELCQLDSSSNINRHVNSLLEWIKRKPVKAAYYIFLCKNIIFLGFIIGLLNKTYQTTS